MNVGAEIVGVSSLSRAEKRPLAPQKVCAGKPSRPNLSMRETAREPFVEPCVERQRMYDGVYGGARRVGG